MFSRMTHRPDFPAGGPASPSTGPPKPEKPAPVAAPLSLFSPRSAQSPSPVILSSVGREVLVPSGRRAEVLKYYSVDFQYSAGTTLSLIAGPVSGDFHLASLPPVSLRTVSPRVGGGDMLIVVQCLSCVKQMLLTLHKLKKKKNDISSPRHKVTILSYFRK